MKKILVVLMMVVLFGNVSVFAEEITVENNTASATVGSVEQDVYSFEITWGSLVYNYGYNYRAGEGMGWVSFDNYITVVNNSNRDTNVSLEWTPNNNYQGVNANFWDLDTKVVTSCEGKYYDIEMGMSASDLYAGDYSDENCTMPIAPEDLDTGYIYIGQHSYTAITSKKLERYSDLKLALELENDTYNGTPNTNDVIGSVKISFSTVE